MSYLLPDADLEEALFFYRLLALMFRLERSTDKKMHYTIYAMHHHWPILAILVVQLLV